MNPRRASTVVLAAACALGVVAFVSPFLPPAPVIGWIVGSSIIAPFERWWYSLPAEARSSLLYDVGTTVGSAVYPVFVAVTFWLWCRPLRRAGSRYPRRTVALAVTAVALSAAYYAYAWRYGLRYQGPELMTAYLTTSAIILLLLTLAWRRYRSSEAWWPSLALHWTLFAWICVWAFPWLGEMI
jgi:hypothetical protein